MLTAKYMAEQINYPLPLTEYGQAIWEAPNDQGCFAMAYVLDSKFIIDIGHSFNGVRFIVNSISIPIDGLDDRKDKITSFCVDDSSRELMDITAFVEQFITFIKMLGNPVFFDSYSVSTNEEDFDQAQ